MSVDFSLSEEQLQIQQAARQFSDGQLAPAAAELDRTGNRETLLKHLRALPRLGFMGINIDPEYGGTGAGVFVVWAVTDPDVGTTG
ncbi:MAG: acyl-CoA dehydrogenase family protein [Spongiibacteraceae bacterium]